jgi:hypothetical protein
MTVVITTIIRGESRDREKEEGLQAIFYQG